MEMPSARRNYERCDESTDSVKGMFILKKTNLQALLQEAIEKAKIVDHNEIEWKIEEESNRLAEKRFDANHR